MTPDHIREEAEHRLATHSTTMAGHLLVTEARIVG